MTRKTFRITVPYSVLCSGTYEHEIEEDEILDYFEVDSMADIDADQLDQYLRETATDAAYDIDTEVLVQDLRDDRSFEAEPDNIYIEEVSE